MHGQSNAVETPLGQKVDIGARQVVAQPSPVKFITVLPSHEVSDACPDGMLRSLLLDAQHITFLQHPTAQSHSTQNDLLTLAVNDPAIPGLKESGRLSTRSLQGEQGGKDRADDEHNDGSDDIRAHLSNPPGRRLFPQVDRLVP